MLKKTRKIECEFAVLERFMRKCLSIKTYKHKKVKLRNCCWYRGPFFRNHPAGPVSTLENWQRLNAWGRKGLLAQRLEKTGSLDIESGYDAFRIPALETQADCLVLVQQVDAILAQQHAKGWWRGECDGISTIKSSAFTRNTIRLVSYLRMSSSGHQISELDNSKHEKQER